MHAMAYTDVTDNVVSAVASSGKASKALQMQPPRTTRMTCFALPTELIFVDCGIFVEVASKFRTDMEERFQKPTSHLLLTHTHWDHCFALSAFEDVKIISSQKGIANLRRGLQTYYRKEARAERAESKYADDAEIREALKSAKLFLPSHGVKDTMIIGTPKGHEILFEVTGGHSADSAFVYSAKERTLCTGDNLLTCYAQIVGNGKKMMKVYERWRAMERLRHIIPGHGEVVRKQYLTKVQNYFEELIVALKELKKQEIPLKQVLNDPSLPEYFGKHQSTWVEGSKYHSGWLNAAIKHFYKNV